MEGTDFTCDDCAYKTVIKTIFGKERIRCNCFDLDIHPSAACSHFVHVVDKPFGKLAYYSLLKSNGGALSESDKYIKPYYERALEGDMGAYTDIASFYTLGTIVEKDPQLAFYYYKTAADAKDGDPIAQYNIGLYFIRGELIPKDEKKGIKYIKKSADSKLWIAANYLGMYHDKRGNVMRARNYYSIAAKQGVASSQYFLALSFLKEGFDDNSADMLRRGLFWLECAYLHDSNDMHYSGKAREILNSLISKGVCRKSSLERGMLKVKTDYPQYLTNPK